MLGDLSGKTALVTGGAQGVGLAIARAMVEQGADVAIGDLAGKVLPQAEAELKHGGHRVLALDMDVTKTPSIESAVSRILSEWGKLDILVNNAGVVGAPGWMDSDEDRDVDWDFVLDVNLRGVVRCCKAAMPHMTARRCGKIVNIASTAGRGGSAVSRARGETTEKPGGSPYAVSKAGVIRYTQALATSLARFNINVNCICPSRMFTQMGIDITVRRQRLEPGLKGSDPLELRHRHATESNAFSRELLPDDIGKMAAFLASEDTHNVTGQTIHVDGGGILI